MFDIEHIYQKIKLKYLKYLFLFTLNIICKVSYITVLPAVSTVNEYRYQPIIKVEH
ncbi:hypothetical protein PCIT_a3786 [Pseudoalteromonas citrea]|uniref:Uncharacterized protein n=1 Tax=Pseudoalteromonas citrea TaxID=43655 RepID=A0AAD4AGG2_9GAMM|nr:hypothetical protein PCIT_a3786 [Pseudoalteromonas citrea]